MFPANLANFYCYETTAVDAWNKFVTIKSKLSQIKLLIDDKKNAEIYQSRPEDEFEDEYFE